MFQSVVYRPYKEATVPVMLPARSVGHYRVNLAWRQTPLNKPFVQLFWGIEGEGRFIQDGEDRRLGPDQVCFYFPGDVHDHTAMTPSWEYRWMTFDGTHSAEVIRLMALRREPFDAGKCPHELFLTLAQEMRDFSPAGQYRASATVYRILTRALMCRDRESGGWNVAAEFKQLVMTRFADPATDVCHLATELGVHRTTLNRVFHAHTGMTPGEYLTSFRVQEALILLKDSHLPVGEIALRTGFRDQNYFTKVIRKYTGSSPVRFRKS